jgi:7-carboxy-7-deazaguanine synthase
MSDKNVFDNLSRLRSHDEVKFVLASRADYDWAKSILSKYDLLSKVSNVLFSPAWDLLSPEDLIAWIKKDNLRVRLNLQLHKYIWGSLRRGV